MQQDQQKEDWLRPTQGRVTAPHWQLLLDTSDVALMQLALYCALRGDCESLTTLCVEVARTGQSEGLLRVGSNVQMSERVPLANGWGTQAFRMELSRFDPMDFQEIVALCLSRPVHQGDVVQPTDSAIAMGGVRHIAQHQASLHPRQRQLLQRAVEVMRLVDTGGPNGPLNRLCLAVASRVGCPLLLDEFAAQGLDVAAFVQTTMYREVDSDSDDRAHALHCHLARQANPVVALAVLRAATGCLGDVEPVLSDAQRRDLAEALIKDRDRCSTDLMWTLDSLRREVGDENLETDERFQAIVALCLHAMGPPAQECLDHLLGTFLALLEDHLKEAGNRRMQSQSMGWCEPFVHAMVEPLKRCPCDALAAAFRSLSQPDNYRVGNQVSAVLAHHCAPVAEILAPALQDILEGDYFEAMGWNGWTLLGQPYYWDPVSSPRHWQETLQVLQQAGLDPTGRIVRECIDEPTGQSRQVFTTLLHVLAECASNHETESDEAEAPRETVLQQMLVLAQMGADVRALDSQGREPAAHFKHPRTAELWRSMANSHQAAVIARQALDMAAQAPCGQPAAGTT